MFWVDTSNSVQHPPANGGNPKHAAKQPAPASANCSSTNVTQPMPGLVGLTKLQQLAPCGVRIERADMDGTKRTTLVNTGLGWPIGLATVHLGTSSSYQYSSYASLLNKQTEDVCSLKHLKVIFIDSKLRTLEMIDLDGKAAFFKFCENGLLTFDLT